jgi:VWFA-related protein
MQLGSAICAWTGLLSVALAIELAPVAGAQQRPDSTRFSASTAGVVVDVVVRDKRGRPVPGLVPDDFQLYEDGAPQRITSFEPVGVSAVNDQPGRASTPSHSRVTEASDLKTPGVIALVHEELSPQGRQLAYNAASAFLGTGVRSDDAVGVFLIDRALHVLVPWSRDVALLRRGIDEASRRPGYAIERAGQIPGAEFGSAQAGESSKATKDDSPYFRAHATFNALDRLITLMRSLPGRKAVVLFSEGFALGPSKEAAVTPGVRWHDDDHWLSDNRYQHFVAVIERANRAQVAFYTFDAAGLRIESPLADACFGCPPYAGLQFLADETGGAFVENTNSLVAGVRRAADDLRQYYLIGYTSSNLKLDGKYRSISVKVRRRGVTVLARKGYRASRESELPKE